jgi:ferritin
MLTPKMLESLNKQINAELYSSYLYLSMAAGFENRNLRGLAKWLKVQAKEEHAHALKFFEFVLQRGGKVALAAIDAPPTEWKSAPAAFKDVAAHEVKVTGMIHNLVELAAREKDHATSSMLKWFVDEQVEEEANANEILAKLEMIKDSVGGLMVLDHHLGKRE